MFNEVHSFTVMLGQEMSSSQNDGFKFQAYGYIPDKGKIFVNLPAYTAHETWDPPVNSKYRVVPVLTETQSNTLSYYATLSYMYDNRYAFNASVRADGNNRFGKTKGNASFRFGRSDFVGMQVTSIGYKDKIF